MRPRCGAARTGAFARAGSRRMTEHTTMTRSHLRRGLGRSILSSTLVLAIGVGAATPAQAAPLQLPPLLVDDPNAGKTANDLGAVFVSMADRLSKETPSGSRTPRENAYSGLCIVLLG